MFSTFTATPSLKRTDQQEEQTREPEPTHVRPKRHQVARACVWCRTYRIKCDASYPCRNCRLSGRKCSDGKGKAEVRTFPSALKEINRLKEQVKELQAQLKGFQVDSSTGNGEELHSSEEAVVALPTNLDPLKQYGRNKMYYSWDAVYTRTAQASQPQCYGPSSSFYFIRRMASYLDTALQERHFETLLQPTLAKQLHVDSVMDTKDARSSIQGAQSFSPYQLLSLREEEALLEMFWQSYHPVFPIIDEAEFKAHHKLLWETSAPYRRPSALVDVLLAVCIQYAASTRLARTNTFKFADIDVKDTTTAGQWYMRRGRALLLDEFESPSIATFQGYYFCVTWLWNASFLNSAHSVLAMGMRIGCILGLHLEPPDEMPRAQQELRKRMWWTMYAIEMQMAMDLGRPLAVAITQVHCSLPDETGCTVSSPESYTAGTDAPGLGACNMHFIELLLAARGVYITFYRKCAEVIGESTHKSLYDDHEGLENCAHFLAKQMKFLETWLQQVPSALKMEQMVGSEQAHTDTTLLKTSHPSLTPPWLYIQRVFLEMQYHERMMELYRPFISFIKSASSKTETPLTERHATSCVSHAMTLTNIIHQVLVSPDSRISRHKAFNTQWNATLSLVGYLLAYPLAPTAHTARSAVSMAMNTFEILSPSHPGASRAADVARDMATKCDLLADRARSPLTLQTTMDITASQWVDTSASATLELGDMQQEMTSTAIGSFTNDTANVDLGALATPIDGEPILFDNAFMDPAGYQFDMSLFDGISTGVVDNEAADLFDMLDFGF